MDNFRERLFYIVGFNVNLVVILNILKFFFVLVFKFMFVKYLLLESIDVVLNGEVVIFCELEGVLKLEIMWLKNNV